MLHKTSSEYGDGYVAICIINVYSFSYKLYNTTILQVVCVQCGPSVHIYICELFYACMHKSVMYVYVHCKATNNNNNNNNNNNIPYVGKFWRINTSKAFGEENFGESASSRSKILHMS